MPRTDCRISLLSTRRNIVAGVKNPTTGTVWPEGEQEFQNYIEQGLSLKDAGVDFLMLEMVKDEEHGSRVCRAAQQVGLPVFLGLTTRVDPGGIVKLRDDDITVEAVIPKFLTACPNICCINVMHTPLDEILQGLRAVKKAWSGPIGAYPNNASSGNRLDWKGEYAKVKSYDPGEFASAVGSWVQCGACYVGGCCGFSPAHINAANSSLYRGAHGATSNLGQVKKLRNKRERDEYVALKSIASAF